MRLLRKIGFAVVLIGTATQASAATVKYDIATPIWSTYYTGSCYGDHGLIANTVINGTQVSNWGNFVRVTYNNVGYTRIYHITVYEVPAGQSVFAIIRQNTTGALRFTNTRFISSPSETVTLTCPPF